ncbi:MAG TPA: hypothetical protein VGM57_04365 [Pseudolabrys sp.]
MTISALSNTSANLSPALDDSRQAFGQLINSIKSGDLSAAQDAYATFSQTPGGQNSGPLSQAVGQIGSALQSGDLDGAQQALTALQQNAKGAHHHGGHHAKPSGDSSQPAAPPATSDASSTASSSNLLDITA